MGWTVRGSNPDGGKIFRTCPERTWGPSSLLYNGYRVFPEGKAAEAWRWTRTPSSVEVQERVELYLYSPSGPWWPVLLWTLSLPSRVRSTFFCDIVQPIVVIPYRRFGTTHRSHLQGVLECGTDKLSPIVLEGGTDGFGNELPLYDA